MRIDSDTHLYEPRCMWRDHVDPGERDLALRLVDDELGHAWLTAPDGRRISIAEVHVPGDVEAVGPLEVGPVLSSVFIWTAPALAIADMTLNGVFARHPDLRLGVMELSAPWLPLFVMYLDGRLDFASKFDDKPRRNLELKPSEYVARHVRVAAFPYENPGKLIRQMGEDMFMYCSDWPHAEGLARPVDDYDAQAGTFDGRAGEQLYAGNVVSLLT